MSTLLREALSRKPPGWRPPKSTSVPVVSRSLYVILGGDALWDTDGYYRETVLRRWLRCWWSRRWDWL